METIKSYLEAMFAGMPNSAEVRKAKSELLQMMEDKYNELIESGQSENTAVGTVISEFGNLDELADDLGLTREIEVVRGKEAETPRRQVTLDEVQSYIENRKKKALFLALGIMLCITSVACPIFSPLTHAYTVGVTLMFLCIGAGVGFIIYSGFADSEFRYITKTLCQIDMSTASYVKDKRRSFEPVRALCVTLGVVLCVICWVPCVMFSTTNAVVVGPALLFPIAGIGVFLIVYSNVLIKGFDILLRLNDRTTISGSYKDLPDSEVQYVSKTAQTIAAIYWPVVVCAYLIVSFLTFQWQITWIIWPIAAVMHRVIMINCVKSDE